MLLDIIKPSSGSITIEGRPASDPEIRKNIGMFDQPAFCDCMRVLIISFYAGFYQCAFYHENSVRWFYFRWGLSDSQQ
jgi:ABC-type multidrug transport system ATPase subunit